MRKKLTSLLSSLLGAVLIVFSSAAPVLAANNNPNGNNGTLKVHEFGTPQYSDPVSGTENNDPKVCVFNFEGFGFDVGQDGYVVIEGQGQTDGTYGNYSFGPTVADPDHTSFAETTYFNDPTPLIPNGHYKATLYGKDTGGNIDLTDEKAKSKVFKVECEEDTPEELDIPAVPSVNDLCGEGNAEWVVPEDTNVLDWELDGEGHLTVTILTPDTKFVDDTISHDFGVAVETNVAACPPERIEIPEIAGVSDLCGSENAEWIVPEDTDVLDWELGINGHLTVTIKTDNTVFTDGETSHDYGVAVETNTDDCEEPCEEEVVLFRLLSENQQSEEDEDCPEEEPVDVCENIDGDQAEVPAGMEVDEEGNCSTPGGQVLGDSDTVTPTPAPAVLAETGSDIALNTFMALFLLGITAGVTLATRKSKVTQ